MFGAGKGKPTGAFAALESVFDQRIAAVLAVLGIPERKAFADLTEKVEALEREIRRLAVAGARRGRR